MKVLLIQSWLGGGEPLVYPLGLASLKAALTGHEVRIFDMNTSSRPFEELAASLDAFAPEIVGIALRNIDSTNKLKVRFYYEHLQPTLDVIRARTTARVVIGGSGFSMFAREIMAREPRLDFGVFLEGEQTFPALLNQLEHPEQVPSLYVRRGDTVSFNAPRGHMDFDAIPLPDRAAVPFAPYAASFRDAAGVETKRGCPLSCIYCIYGFLNGKAYRFRSPARVVEDIEQVVSAHGASRFTFVDSVFNLPKHHALAICRGLAERKLPVKWSAWVSEKGLDREFIELAMQAGCDHMILSPDGFSDRTLDLLGKHMKQQEILDGFELLAATPGLEISYNFFINPPGQSLAAFLSMMAFCFRAKRRLRRRVHFELSTLRVEPNTRLRDIAVREGQVRVDDDLLYPRGYTNPGTAYIQKAFQLLWRLRKSA